MTTATLTELQTERARLKELDARRELDEATALAVRNSLSTAPNGAYGETMNIEKNTSMPCASDQEKLAHTEQEIQEICRGSIERFFKSWIEGVTIYPVCACATWQIYRAYSRWCVAGGEKPRNQNSLSGYLYKQPGWRITLKYVFEDAYYAGTPRRIRMVIPEESLLVANAVAIRYRESHDKTEVQLATDSFFRFNRSLGVR